MLQAAYFRISWFINRPMWTTSSNSNKEKQKAQMIFLLNFFMKSEMQHSLLFPQRDANGQLWEFMYLSSSKACPSFLLDMMKSLLFASSCWLSMNIYLSANSTLVLMADWKLSDSYKLFSLYYCLPAMTRDISDLARQPLWSSSTVISGSLVLACPKRHNWLPKREKINTGKYLFCTDFPLQSAPGLIPRWLLAWAPYPCWPAASTGICNQNAP